MRLQRSTDYALRVLLYLVTAEADAYVPASEIAEAYGLSVHHVSKITKDLTARGWLEGRRGAGGGVRLAVDPGDLALGQVVVALEPLDLVECFNADTDTCQVTPACALKHALHEAAAAFVAALDGYTLADLPGAQRRTLRRLLSLD